MPARARVSLGILAGGRGARLGGVDKAFLHFCGEPMLDRVLAAAGDGFGQRLVSHNDPRNPARKAWLDRGIVFVADRVAAGEGPLSGLHAVLHAAQGDWLLSLPVDLRQVPSDMVESLLATEGAVARDADGLQPLVALWPRRDALSAAEDALAAGERAVQYLARSLRLPVLDFGDRELGNLNTPADFDPTK